MLVLLRRELKLRMQTMLEHLSLQQQATSVPLLSAITDIWVCRKTPAHPNCTASKLGEKKPNCSEKSQFLPVDWWHQDFWLASPTDMVSLGFNRWSEHSTCKSVRHFWWWPLPWWFTIYLCKGCLPQISVHSQSPDKNLTEQLWGVVHERAADKSAETIYWKILDGRNRIHLESNVRPIFGLVCQYFFKGRHFIQSIKHLERLLRHQNKSPVLRVHRVYVPGAVVRLKFCSNYVKIITLQSFY